MPKLLKFLKTLFNEKVVIITKLSMLDDLVKQSDGEQYVEKIFVYHKNEEGVYKGKKNI